MLKIFASLTISFAVCAEAATRAAIHRNDAARQHFRILRVIAEFITAACHNNKLFLELHGANRQNNHYLSGKK
jgi:hypothetical protein